MSIRATRARIIATAVALASLPALVGPPAAAAHDSGVGLKPCWALGNTGSAPSRLMRREGAAENGPTIVGRRFVSARSSAPAPPGTCTACPC